MVRRIVLGMLLLLVAALSWPAVLHFVRGVKWLKTTDQPFQQKARHGASFTFSKSAEFNSLRNDLKQIGIALHNYHEIYGSFPAGGTFGANGEGLHSWISPLQGLMMFTFDGKLNYNEPWDSIPNEKYFRSVLYEFSNPMLPAAPVVNEHGFALSHFAANVHVMGPNRFTKLEDITDGTGNTLLIGEVNSLFQPWGAPTNWRDPMLGLNTSPRGFGSHPMTRGVNFVMADGSVRFILNDIDPDVLKALATPAGGESIDENDW